jgi:predicted transposase/invertase (TIGR01784 family)
VAAHQYDSAYKFLFANRRIFYEFLVSFVPEPFVREIGPEDLSSMDKSFVSEEMTRRDSDIMYRIRRGNEDIYVVVLVEFQSSPDPAMPIRVLSYVMRLYEELLTNRRRLPFPAVLPIVLYNGSDPWRVSESVEAVIEQRIDSDYIPKFRYLCIVEREIPDETLFQLNNLVAATVYLEKLKDSRTLRNALDRIVEMLRGEDILDVDRFAAWAQMVLRPRTDKKLTQRIHSLSEVKPMLARLAEQLRDEGREEGREIALRDVALRLLRKGRPLEEIAEATGLPVEELADMRRQDTPER